MNLLIKEIQWDTEGQTLEECELPNEILWLDFPDTVLLWPEFNVYDLISTNISDIFGFNLTGFTYSDQSQWIVNQKYSPFTRLAIVKLDTQ